MGEGKYYNQLLDIVLMLQDGGNKMIGTIIARHMLRRGFDHLNNGDIEAFLKSVADDAVIHYPGNLPISGKHRGKAAIREWFRTLFSLFSEYRFTVKNIYMKDVFAFGPSNSAALEFDFEATSINGSPYKNTILIVIHLNNAKVVAWQEFIFDYEAAKVAWASLETK